MSDPRVFRVRGTRHVLGGDSLPTSVGAYKGYGQALSKGPLQCVVEGRNIGNSKIVCDVFGSVSWPFWVYMGTLIEHCCVCTAQCFCVIGGCFQLVQRKLWFLLSHRHTRA